MLSVGHSLECCGVGVESTSPQTARSLAFFLLGSPQVGVTHRPRCCPRFQDNADAFEKLDLQRVGVLVGTGMGGLQVPAHEYKASDVTRYRVNSCLHDCGAAI